MYTCSFCVAEGGDPVALTFTSDVAWLNHLCSPDHGAKQRIQGAKKSFAHWDDKRTIVVSGVFGLKQWSLVNYFAGLGDLQNFYYVYKKDGGSNYCKALMAEEKSAKQIHKTGHHTIGGVTFQTRLQNQPAATGTTSTKTSAAGTVTATAPLKTPSLASSSSAPTSDPTSIGSSTVSSSTPAGKGSKWDKFRRLNAADEGGFVPGVGYRCRICEQVVGKGEEKWVQHLISKEHQDNHRKNMHMRKVLWDLDKTLRIFKIKGMEAVHILRYVAAFGGPVVDFSYLAKEKGGTSECHVLFANRDGAEKLTKSNETHCIGPQRRNVGMALLKDAQKLKFRVWREKLLLKNVGDEPSVCISASEDEEDKDDEINGGKVVEKEAAKPTPVLEGITKKRKSCELSHVVSDVSKSFSGFAGLSLAKQLEKLPSEFGWSSQFLSSAVKFADQTVGSLHLKQKKLPFGDLTTGLGLQISPTFQLLVDVQDILESKPDSANTVILSMLKNCSQALDGLKTKGTTAHPILKIWTTDTEVCLNTEIEKLPACLKLRFSNALPFHECSLFKFCADLDSRILPMSFFICHWATSNNFLQYSKQSYPNQLILLMIISYLQLKKVLPTVQKLIEICPDSESPKMINGNTVSFCTDLYTVKKLHPNPLESLLQDDTIRAMSVLGLLRDWFQFFSSSDLKENAICSRFGAVIPKKDFQPDSVGNLPGDLCRVYRFGMSKKGGTESVMMKKFMCSQTPLCIQNPFDLSLNCSRGITPNEVLRFQNGCNEASSILSTLLTCDQPDLTQFLSIAIPPVEKKTANVNKKVKIEEVVIDNTPRKSNDSIAIVPNSRVDAANDKVASSSSSIKTINSTPIRTPTKVTTPGSSKKASTSPAAMKSPPNSKGSVGDKTSRPGAADFFDAIVSEPESGDPDGDDDEEDASMDDESVLSDATNKDCTISLNISLFKYFERVFPGTRDMKFKKCQLLILQHILDFNAKFWTNCLGLVFLPKVGQKFWPEDFSKVVGEGKVPTDQTLLQKVMAIAESENKIDLSFRVQSQGGVIHKLFLEDDPKSLRPKTWAAGNTLTECSLLLYEEVPESRLDEVKSATFVGCNQLTQQKISFDCRLFGAAFNKFGNSTPLATLTMNVSEEPASPGCIGTSYARIDVIKALYRKLGMSFITKMVKGWLAESKDFDHEKASNFVTGRNQIFNRKANKKRKNIEKKQQRGLTPPNSKIHVHSPTKISVHNPSSNSQPSTSFRPQQQQQFFSKPRFQSPSPVRQQIPIDRGRGFNSLPKPHYQYSNPQRQQPLGGVGRGFGRGRPFDDQYNYHPYHQQQQQYSRPYGSYEPPPPSSDRILRNPGPQGMRTFYPPYQQPSQAQSAHLLPNPQFSANQTQTSYNSFVEGIDNAELSFQSLPQAPQPHQGQQPFHHGLNPKKAGININDGRQPPSFLGLNTQYQNSILPGGPLLPNPAPSNPYQIQPRNYAESKLFSFQGQQQQHPHYDNGQHHQHHYQPQEPHYFEALTNNEREVPPLIYNSHFEPEPFQGEQFPNPNYDRKPNISNNLNPNVRHFHNTRMGHHGPQIFNGQDQLPMPNLPRSSFEDSYSRPDRPVGPQNSSYSNNMQNPAFESYQRHEGQRAGMDTQTSAPRPSRYFNASNNHNEAHPFPYVTRTSLPNREVSNGSRPSQPAKRGFVSGGYLSTKRGDGDESSSDSDDLQIIYDVDPKGNSSPPPPPLKKYKIGPAFPVPSKPPSLGRGRRSPSPNMYRNPMAEQRKGFIGDPRNSSSDLYGPSSFPNPRAKGMSSFPVPDLLDSPNNFQELGVDPFGGDSSQYGGRRF